MIAAPAVRDPAVRITEIKVAIAERFGVSIADLDSRARPARIALARQVGMWLARRTIKVRGFNPGEVRPISFQDVAEGFRRDDHATVTHAVKQVEALRETDGQFRLQTNDLLFKFSPDEKFPHSVD